jgi:putative restriction endonuclease
MKAPDWDEHLLAEHRQYLSSESARHAFDTLVLAALLVPAYECSPARHGDIRDFRYKDRASGEWPFAFIVNRRDLLFYVRKQGVRRVAGGLAALNERFHKVEENDRGEFTVRVSSREEARRLTALLFGEFQSSLVAVDHWWVNHRQAPRQEIEGGYLWLSDKNKSEVNNESFRNMLAAQAGDIVFSFADAVVGAVGIVLGRAREIPEPPESGATTGKRKIVSGWQVPVRFIEFEQPLRTMEHAKDLASVRPKKHAPLRPSGVGVRGVYLSAVPDAMVIVLRRLLGGQVETVEQKIRAAIGGELLDERAEEAIRRRTDIGPTTKEKLIRARRGHGVYRQNLEEIEGGCRLTGLLDRRHLIASHIKPWRESDDREKLDGFNGLLFSPHIGHLFDRGYVSFSDAGELLASRHLNPRVLTVWHIVLPSRVDAFRPEQCVYLDYHRREVFEKHDRGRRSASGG